MAKEIGVSGKLKVRTLKQRFLDEYGVAIRVYSGAAFADDEATLASIRVEGAAPSEDFSVHGKTKVANVEKQFLESVGVRIRVEDSSGNLASGDATLASLRTASAETDDAEEESKGIHVHGNSKLGKLRKEFNEKFPFLRLGIFAPEAKALVEKGERIQQLPSASTIASVRTKVGSGDVSIHGKKKVVTLEREFESEYGLYVQICYTDAAGTRIYTTGEADQMSLSALNRQGEKDGWKQGEWE